MECTVFIIQGDTPGVSTPEQLTIILWLDKKVITESFDICKCKFK